MIDFTSDRNGKPFEARYDGKCGSCGDRFMAGDDVVYVDDTLLAMECCGGDAGPVVRPPGHAVRKPCPRGFQIPRQRDGGCGCDD